MWSIVSCKIISNFIDACDFPGTKALFRLIQNDSNDGSMEWVLKIISAKIDSICTTQIIPINLLSVNFYFEETKWNWFYNFFCNWFFNRNRCLTAILNQKYVNQIELIWSFRFSYNFPRNSTSRCMDMEYGWRVTMLIGWFFYILYFFLHLQ